ncbi:hypothetical protein [Novosphingobium marinum]|uniref:Uncharacterized protein n=1 Tax=Novosphingobium marinum TaxID=1514948 RepID=A0A7Z0BUK6_9SPHN|nr:hypothetical protein [Novosphingobium marinum]NYH95298.1 hypothetical protein [Novosphingobium marinum]
MKYLVIGLGALGLVYFAVIGAVLFWQFGPKTSVMGFDTRAVSRTAGYSAGALGGVRHNALLDATETYVETHDDVAPKILAGEAFAPVPFLNKQLEKDGEAFRVRSTDGMTALFYEVS